MAGSGEQTENCPESSPGGERSSRSREQNCHWAEGDGPQAGREWQSLLSAQMHERPSALSLAGGPSGCCSKREEQCLTEKRNPFLMSIDYIECCPKC